MGKKFENKSVVVRKTHFYGTFVSERAWVKSLKINLWLCGKRIFMARWCQKGMV
ncbi:MAG: hypothetical protein FWH07_08065 [Oscillospiraceae bacterium]|nr:hypothetical protein [Oscillospiraceae bacterium]